MKTQFDISLQFDFKKVTGEKKIFSAACVEEAFFIMKALGVKYFNTWCNDDVYPTSDEEDIFFAQVVAKKMQETGIEMSSFHFVGSVLDCYADSQEKIYYYMERFLKIFSICKPRNVVLHPGTFTEGGFRYNKLAHQEAVRKWGEQRTHSILVDNLRHFGRLAEGCGTRLAVENIFQGRFYSKIDELLSLVHEVNLDNVGFCLDCGHANVDHVNIPETIRLMGSKLFELHLHDNNGVSDQHLPVGFGTLNWIPIIQALRENHYEGTATFEYFRWPYLDKKTGIQNSIQMWRTLERISEEGYVSSDWS